MSEEQDVERQNVRGLDIRRWMSKNRVSEDWISEDGCQKIGRSGRYDTWHFERV
ncbi:MAG: hypothetical protein HFG86_12655 [Dorea sp.]|nr:hypothetical protein [Dorea sp.]